MRSEVLKMLQTYLRPEFLNRIDETIVFAALGREEIKEIVRLQLKRLTALLKDKDIELEVTDGALDYIADIGYSPTFGARPIKRLINKELTQQIARKILAGAIKADAKVTVDFSGGEIVIR